jgi:hypothetical protein
MRNRPAETDSPPEGDGFEPSVPPRRPSPPSRDDGAHLRGRFIAATAAAAGRGQGLPEAGRNRPNGRISAPLSLGRERHGRAGFSGPPVALVPPSSPPAVDPSTAPPIVAAPPRVRTSSPPARASSSAAETPAESDDAGWGFGTIALMVGSIVVVVTAVKQRAKAADRVGLRLHHHTRHALQRLCTTTRPSAPGPRAPIGSGLPPSRRRVAMPRPQPA